VNAIIPKEMLASKFDTFKVAKIGHAFSPYIISVLILVCGVDTIPKSNR
jgi:hypothetical protein